MASIPNSSRYRTAGSAPSANPPASGREGRSDPRSGHRGRAVDKPFFPIWVLGFLALGLLITFPYYVLGVIGLGLLINWLFGKK